MHVHISQRRVDPITGISVTDRRNVFQPQRRMNAGNFNITVDGNSARTVVKEKVSYKKYVSQKNNNCSVKLSLDV